MHNIQAGKVHARDPAHDKLLLKIRLYKRREKQKDPPRTVKAARNSQMLGDTFSEYVHQQMITQASASACEAEGNLACEPNQARVCQIINGAHMQSTM